MKGFASWANETVSTEEIMDNVSQEGFRRVNRNINKLREGAES